jgi:signal transduction histidine kinase
VTRQRPEVESAVYFSCLEALQNAAKHGGGGTRVRITLEQGRSLDFDVADDGEGFAPDDTTAGLGLRNMHDRVESVGGTLTIRSSPGRGTVVHGSVPLAPRAYA